MIIDRKLYNEIFILKFFCAKSYCIPDLGFKTIPNSWLKRFFMSIIIWTSASCFKRTQWLEKNIKVLLKEILTFLCCKRLEVLFGNSIMCQYRDNMISLMYEIRKLWPLTRLNPLLIPLSSTQNTYFKIFCL